MHEEDRLKMGRRARERILAQHSSQTRAAEFESIVGRCTGKSSQASGISSAKERMQSSGRSTYSSSNL
jgi:predicted Zn-dependent protease